MSGWLGVSQAFYPIEEYPELEILRSNWKTIRDEAWSLREQMLWIEDERTRGKAWAFAPLRVEEEDRDVMLDKVGRELRSEARRTVELVSQVPGVLGYAFSLLLAGATIAEHAHSNPYVTAILGLEVEAPCWIRVASDTRAIKEQRFVIFDYTLPHEVRNESKTNRLVLLVLLPDKRKVKS